MSQIMYVSHSRFAVDLGKILQCGSAENKTAKLVEDIASEYIPLTNRVRGPYYKYLSVL